MSVTRLVLRVDIEPSGQGVVDYDRRLAAMRSRPASIADLSLEPQRAWLAMLVAQDADGLLLDEPIAALDLAHQLEVLTLVRQLSHARGLGIIVVLHNVNMAARFCDEIIALHSGQLIARGAPEQIVQPNILRAIYGVGVGVMPHPDSGTPLAFV